MSQVKVKTNPDMMIDFIDLASQQREIRSNLDLAISRVLDHGIYIMGPEVQALEQQLAEFCGAKYALSCANGTDALVLALMAKFVGPGHAVFVPSFTFVATAEAVVWMGATPIYVDVQEDTFNICPHSLELAIKTAHTLGLKPHGVITVDLFGQPADYDAIEAITDNHGLWLMCDAAQSFGATYKDRKVGNIGDITTTSFYPAKPLGCYGDGGAILTNDEEQLELLKSLRVHGQGKDRYDNVRIGMNGRLDTLQAAILIEKLKIFSKEIQNRQCVADYYTKSLQDLVQTPKILLNTTSVWAQYTLRLHAGIDRTEMMLDLKNLGVPTVIYYPKPLHQQIAYQKYPTAGQASLPNSEQLAKTVLSLPISGYISVQSQEYVVEVLTDYLKDKKR